MATKYCIVWEYKDDLNQWIPYNAEVCYQLEKANSKKFTTLWLGDIDPIFACYTIHFSTKCYQQNQDTGTKRRVRRRVVHPKYTCPILGISWQWFGNKGIYWGLFSLEVQEIIEESFMRGEDRVDLEVYSPSLTYILDFTTMAQIQKSTRNIRAVRRASSRPYPSLKGGPTIDSDLNNTNATSVFVKSLDDTVDENGMDNTHFKDSAGSYSSKILSWFKTQKPKTKSKSNGQESDTNCSSTTRSKTTVEHGTKQNKAQAKAQSSCFRVGRKTVTVDNAPSNGIEILNSELIFQRYTRVVRYPPNDTCIICCDPLDHDSSYAENSVTVSFVRCGHLYHKSCLSAMLESYMPATFIQCPTCKDYYGVKTGNQPEGKMEYFGSPMKLPGHDDCGTICIVYKFQKGIQGLSHPNPGTPYTAFTFPRHCYLPNNEKGRLALQLLCIAWQRKLTFTVGTSVTTGECNVVTWNEIHHKTNCHNNYSGHGYPDPTYLDNVMMELAIQGVTEKDLSSMNE